MLKSTMTTLMDDDHDHTLGEMALECLDVAGLSRESLGAVMRMIDEEGLEMSEAFRAAMVAIVEGAK